MIVHNSSSSSDASWIKSAVPYEGFDLSVSDINERELTQIGLTNDLEGQIWGRGFLARVTSHMTSTISLSKMKQIGAAIKAINLCRLG